MSTNVGDRESTGGRNAQSRDGMTSALNDDGNFSPRCLSLDLEVGLQDRRIHAFAALRPDTGGRLVSRSGDVAAAPTFPARWRTTSRKRGAPGATGWPRAACCSTRRTTWSDSSGCRRARGVPGARGPGADAGACPPLPASGTGRDQPGLRRAPASPPPGASCDRRTGARGSARGPGGFARTMGVAGPIRSSGGAPGAGVRDRLRGPSEPPGGMRCPSAAVHAVVTWSREASEPEFQSGLKCDRWEVVVPELIFEPEAQSRGGM